MQIHTIKKGALPYCNLPFGQLSLMYYQANNC